MMYLHTLKKRVVHNDLKPCNVLLDEKGVPKICDFGMSKMKGSSQSSKSTKIKAGGTLAYNAPELLRPPFFGNHKLDIWAFGILVCELFAEQKPFNQFSTLQRSVSAQEEAIRHSIKQGDLPSMDKLPSDMLQDLVTACCHQNPKRRPEFTDIFALLLGRNLSLAPPKYKETTQDGASRRSEKKENKKEKKIEDGQPVLESDKLETNNPFTNNPFPVRWQCCVDATMQNYKPRLLLISFISPNEISTCDVLNMPLIHSFSFNVCTTWSILLQVDGLPNMTQSSGGAMNTTSTAVFTKTEALSAVPVRATPHFPPTFACPRCQEQVMVALRDSHNQHCRSTPPLSKQPTSSAASLQTVPPRPTRLPPNKTHGQAQPKSQSQQQQTPQVAHAPHISATTPSSSVPSSAAKEAKQVCTLCPT